jgi:hypothetical protein
MGILSAAPVGALSDIADSKLRRLFQYWTGKCAGRFAPSRRDIDPVEIPELLGLVNLFEVRENPRDFRVRLNGTAVAEMIGRDVTGEFCSAVMHGEDAVRCKEALEMCVDRRAPVLAETSLAFCGKPYMCQTIVILPLSSDGERIDMIITAHSYRAIEAPGQPVDLLPRRRAGTR